MSRYTELSTLAQAVYRHIQPHSSLRPISLGELLRAHPAASADIPNALKNLIDARLITSMRHTVDGVATVVYWPTGLKPIKSPTLEHIRMSSEPKNAHLSRLVLLHGPITGPALAEKAREGGANIPAKNVPGLLETRLKYGDIIARKINGVTLYMTPTQAATDATESGVYEAGAQGGGDIYAPDETGAHVMSAPSDETSELKARIHDLLNDAAGANMLLQHLAQKLCVEKFEDIPGAFDELTQALAARAMQPEPEAGRLALLLIDSAELTEIEELDPQTIDVKRLAMVRIEQGHAARAVVVRIIGEAVRQAKWKAAA